MRYYRDPQVQLDPLNQTSDRLYSANQSPAALKTLKHGLANAEETKNEEKQIDALTGLGCLYCSLEDYVVAMKYLKKALQIAQDLRISHKVILVCYYMGEVYLKSEHYNEALTCYETALRILEYRLELSRLKTPKDTQNKTEIKSRYFSSEKYFNKRANLAIILERLGLVELCLERPLNAQEFCDRALKTYQKLDDRVGEARILDYLGAVHYKRGNASRAIWYHLQALGLFRNLNSESSSSETKIAHINLLYQRLGLHCEGLKLYRRVLMILKNLDRAKNQQVV